jgi:hypothetical protein
MKIEELKVSEDCLARMKRTGITVVEEIIEAIEQAPNAMINAPWILCVEEIVNRLEAMGLWTPSKD